MNKCCFTWYNVLQMGESDIMAVMAVMAMVTVNMIIAVMAIMTLKKQHLLLPS